VLPVASQAHPIAACHLASKLPSGAGAWPEAHRQREGLLQYITAASGVGTLLDHRRARDYDADHIAQRYLNQAPVKARALCIRAAPAAPGKHWDIKSMAAPAQEALGVPEHVSFEECSEEVGDALGPDVMKSVKHLIPDILASLPLLLYQGAP
jgi:vitellogenic carboxypeptidase-like protein